MIVCLIQGIDRNVLLLQVFEGSTLVIEKMDISRAGVYSCAATNSDQGKPAVAVATLTLYSESDSVHHRGI